MNEFEYRSLAPSGYTYTHTNQPSKPNVTQAPHLPSRPEPARLSGHDPRPKPNKHADGVAHSKLLARTGRPHDAQINALKRRRIWHARTPRTERKEHGDGGRRREAEDADEADDAWPSRCHHRHRWWSSSPSEWSAALAPALPERAKSILYAGNPGNQNCTRGNGGAGGTTAPGCSRSRSPASGATVDVGSGCAGHEATYEA